MNNSVDGRADSSFARLACFRWHDGGASAGVMIVGERSLSVAITSPFVHQIGMAVFHSCRQRPV